MRSVLAALSTCALLAGCGAARDGVDAHVDSDAAPPAEAMELGTGEARWEPLPATGGRAELVFGPQGGYHVWARIRFHGFQPDVDIELSARRLDDGTLVGPPQPFRRLIAEGRAVGLTPLEGGGFETRAELVILDIRCASEVAGREVRVEASVRERASGRTLTDAKVVTVVDEAPASPACESR